MACCLVSRSLKKVIYCPQVGSTSTKWSPNSKLSQSFPKTVSKNIKSFSKGYPKLSKSFPKGVSTYLNISQKCLEVVPKLFYTAKLSLFLVYAWSSGTSMWMPNCFQESWKVDNTKEKQRCCSNNTSEAISFTQYISYFGWFDIPIAQCAQ